MKRVCNRKVMIDALTVCFEVENRYHYDYLVKLRMGEIYEFYEFRLCRVEGRYYDNVYAIVYDVEGQDVEFGQLKFNFSRGTAEANLHTNGKLKVWITLNNPILYNSDRHNLDFIATKLGLEVHNVTAIDLCLDTPFNISKRLKQLIRDKECTTILNGKRIVDRDADRPEISYTLSGSLNKDKYMTVNVKQRNAIKDKTKGITVITYDKKGEIENSSNKSYIMEYYGNPNKLYRTEVHLNNAEFREYIENRDIQFNVYMMDEAILEAMFFHHLNSVIRFKRGKDNIQWEHLLGRMSA